MFHIIPSHISRLDYSVVSTDGDLLTIQFQVPSAFAATLPTLLRSLAESFTMMGQKARVAQATARARDPELIKQREEERLKADQTILHRFDRFVLSGMNNREAIRATRDYFNSRGLSTTSYIIELTVRQYGRLSKKKNGLIISSNRLEAKGNKNKSL
ncbi:hypothetical protein SAMN02745119_03364 [Trichlorobacter thiogenes]|uniref:Uncharacterized protein n=1 Tax=Trichlorobacter thiogenes TaxID=115783 RepID=A0A1T4SB59_9BACT|nr:hypothetical protein [Trichlorobacter thiogenes]SKA25081.1 hypothetical protein SAMN02745119_03364 [Trichlorobacter thiogenes]